VIVTNSTLNVEMKLINVIYCRLRELAEGKKQVNERQMEASNSGDGDMNPVVRLDVLNGMQSLAASGSSKQRKRKRQVSQVNGSVDDMDDAEKTNNCSLENGEKNIPRKKLKKLKLPENTVMSGSQEMNGTFAGEATAAAAADPQSVSEDEVEIWIPSKKYKGPLREVYAKLAGDGSRKIKCSSPKQDDSTPFMTFIPMDRTPTALVRRRNKLSQSEPKQLHRSVSFMSIYIYMINFRMLRRFFILFLC